MCRILHETQTITVRISNCIPLIKKSIPKLSKYLKQSGEVSVVYGVIFFSRGRGNIFKHGFYLLVLTEKSGMKSVIVMEHVNTDNS